MNIWPAKKRPVKKGYEIIAPSDLQQDNTSLSACASIKARRAPQARGTACLGARTRRKPVTRDAWCHALVSPHRPARLQANCNWRGSCRYDQAVGAARCKCEAGQRYPSPECAQELDCMNGCRGRGQCLRGVCRCEKGFWGQDCSSTRDANGRLAVLDAGGPGLLVRPDCLPSQLTFLIQKISAVVNHARTVSHRQSSAHVDLSHGASQSRSAIPGSTSTTSQRGSQRILPPSTDRGWTTQDRTEIRGSTLSTGRATERCADSKMDKGSESEKTPALLTQNAR